MVYNGNILYFSIVYIQENKAAEQRQKDYRPSGASYKIKFRKIKNLSPIYAVWSLVYFLGVCLLFFMVGMGIIHSLAIALTTHGVVCCG